MTNPMFAQVEIPYGGYWSTPFVRWQGAFQHLRAIRFAAHVASRALGERNIDAKIFDAGVLGMSVYQHQSFYGTPWFMSLLGAPQAPTGMRLIIELIEELVLRGGGRGLFTGCAAGDTAMALILSVDSK